MRILTALVHIAILFDGERHHIAPGERVPDLHPRDVQALKESGSIEDSDDVARTQRSDAAEQKRAAKDFTEARKDVVAQTASINEANAAAAQASENPDPAGSGTVDDGTAGAGKQTKDE